jgi:hypothetical protein
MNELSPRDLLERFFRRWPLIALAIVLGGMAGWLASYLFTPVYEARAEIYIDLDSGLWAQENHPGNPVEFAIANGIRPITALFYSDATIRDLLAAAREENIPLDEDTVLNTFTIQRVNMTWLMTVRSHNPQYAARLADLWVQVALPLHQAAHEHAVSAYALTVQRDALSACFDKATLSAGNACAGTSFPSLADLEPALASLDAQIAAEQESSLGLDPALTVLAGAPAAVPAEPVRDRRSWLALAGTMIGFILGIVASQITFPATKEKVRAE